MNTANKAVAFVAFQMAVTQLNKSTKKREPIGSVEIYLPTIESLGIVGDKAINADKTPLLNDDGLPVYVDDALNFLQDSLSASVKAVVRNRLDGIKLRDGAIIPKNWDELTAEVVRSGGGGAGLIIYQEAKQAFNKYIQSLGKSAQAYTIITGYFSNKKQLEVADKETKGKMEGYITDFAATLNEEQLVKFEKTLQSLLDLCKLEAVQADDF